MTPYALLAYDDEGPNDVFWVQYDSTYRDGDRWTAEAYLEGSSPGDSFVLQVVLVLGTIAAPPDPNSGLLWDDVLNSQHPQVVAESEPIRVTI